MSIVRSICFTYGTTYVNVARRHWPFRTGGSESATEIKWKVMENGIRRHFLFFKQSSNFHATIFSLPLLLIIIFDIVRVIILDNVFA